MECVSLSIRTPLSSRSAVCRLAILGTLVPHNGENDNPAYLYMNIIGCKRQYGLFPAGQSQAASDPKKGPPNYAARAVYQGLIYGFFTIQSTSFTINIYFPIRTMVKWLSFFMSFFRRSELKNGTAKYGGY
jgi:hypothetical protein